MMSQVQEGMSRGQNMDSVHWAILAVELNALEQEENREGTSDWTVGKEAAESRHLDICYLHYEHIGRKL